MWSVWRSSMKGIGEEATMETMLPELVLRNPLVGEGVSGNASIRTRNAFNLHLASLLSTLDFPLHSRAQVSSSFISFSNCFALA